MLIFVAANIEHAFVFDSAQTGRKPVMRRATRAVVTASVMLASLGTASAAHAETTSAPVGGGVAPMADTSTKLSSGTLYFTATNGRSVSGNASLFYSVVRYDKSSGSTISVKFLVDKGSSELASGIYSIASGQSKSHSFGGSGVPSSCRVVGGMDVAGQGYFWTPALNPC